MYTLTQMQRSHGKGVVGPLRKWFPPTDMYHEIVLMQRGIVTEVYPRVPICFADAGVCEAAGWRGGAGGLTASPVDATSTHPPVEILLAVTPPLDDSPASTIRHVTVCQERLLVCSGPDPVVAVFGLLPIIHGGTI